MADSTNEEGRTTSTSPTDSPCTDPPTTGCPQEDIQRQLDDALNSSKLKDNEIKNLRNLCSSLRSETDKYRVKAMEAQKTVQQSHLAQKTELEQMTALLAAAESRVQTLESSLKDMALTEAQNKSSWEALLKSKDNELEGLKKIIAMKDERINALLNGSSPPPPNLTQEKKIVAMNDERTNALLNESSPPPPTLTQENSSVEVPPPPSESSPKVRHNSVEEFIKLSPSSVLEEIKNGCDFVNELLQTSRSPATDDKYDSLEDLCSSDDYPSFEDSDDLDYDPNPDYYRNKTVKKLKRKRKVKNKAKRTHTSTTPTTSGGGTFECPICPLKEDGTKHSYAGVTGLNYHMSINHPNQPGFNTERFQCSDCPEIFVRKQDLTNHLRSAHMEVRYKCKFCPKSFTSPYYCHHHEKLHKNTGGGPAVLKCDKCLKVFSSKLGLHQHQVTIHPHGGGHYNCKHCDASFRHLKALRLHITTNHRRKSLKCPHCPKMYTKKGGLRRHVQTHLNSEDSKGSKPEVKVGGGLRHSREAKRQLVLHLEAKGISQELGGANQSCSTSVDSVIAEFIPGITLGSLPEETTCQYCGMEFSQSQGRLLKIHLSRHRFKCIKCVDVFDQASSLRYHLSVTHKIEGEEAEELVGKGVQPVGSQTTATKSEPDVGTELELLDQD